MASRDGARTADWTNERPRPACIAASAASGTTRSAIGRPKVASPSGATPLTIASMSAPGVDSETVDSVSAAAPRMSTTTITSLEMATATTISPRRRNHEAVRGHNRRERIVDPLTKQPHEYNPRAGGYSPPPRAGTGSGEDAQPGPAEE